MNSLTQHHNINNKRISEKTQTYVYAAYKAYTRSPQVIPFAANLWNVHFQQCPSHEYHYGSQDNNVDVAQMLDFIPEVEEGGD